MLLSLLRGRPLHVSSLVLPAASDNSEAMVWNGDQLRVPLALEVSLASSTPVRLCAALRQDWDQDVRVGRQGCHGPVLADTIFGDHGVFRHLLACYLLDGFSQGIHSLLNSTTCFPTAASSENGGTGTLIGFMLRVRNRFLTLDDLR